MVKKEMVVGWLGEASKDDDGVVSVFITQGFVSVVCEIGVLMRSQLVCSSW